MAVEHLEDVITSIERMPVAAGITDLRTYRVVAANARAAAIFGLSVEDLVGTDVLAHVRPEDREAVILAYSALASGAIDGYQVRREFITKSGQALAVHVWTRRVQVSGDCLGLWFLVPQEELPAQTQVPTELANVVLALTDHDWQIEYMSADALLLGVRGSQLRGYPLLGLVHPSAVGDFLIAVERAVASRLGVTVYTRLRFGGDRWVDRYCFLTRMCDHQPPRLGVIVSVGPSALAEADRGHIDAEAQHCALEARAAQSLVAVPALRGLPPGGELSARQTEIVSRLIAGENVASIARAIFLSPNTVRNHLAGVYRKFGVHSQAELLATLLRAQASFGKEM